MHTPLVSIIVPIYKVEPYLRRCLDSIVNQTYTNLEIILVDDGSPDGCPQICDEYAAKDNRIVVIHKKNGGLSDARNAGLDICKGEYISFVDSDDWIAKKYTEILVDNALYSSADIIIGNHDLVWNNKNEASIPFKNEIIDSKEAFRKIILTPTIQLGVAWGKIYHKRIFFKERFPKGKIHEDDYTSYKLIYTANKICCVSTILYHYYQRTDSISKTDVSYDFMNVEDERFVFLMQQKEFELAKIKARILYWYWMNKLSKEPQKMHQYISRAKLFYSGLTQIPHIPKTELITYFLVIKFPRLYLIYKRYLRKII